MYWEIEGFNQHLRYGYDLFFPPIIYFRLLCGWVVFAFSLYFVKLNTVLKMSSLGNVLGLFFWCVCNFLICFFFCLDHKFVIMGLISHFSNQAACFEIEEFRQCYKELRTVNTCSGFLHYCKIDLENRFILKRCVVHVVNVTYLVEKWHFLNKIYLKERSKLIVPLRVPSKNDIKSWSPCYLIY